MSYPGLKLTHREYELAIKHNPSIKIINCTDPSIDKCMYIYHQGTIRIVTPLDKGDADAMQHYYDDVYNHDLNYEYDAIEWAEELCNGAKLPILDINLICDLYDDWKECEGLYELHTGDEVCYKDIPEYKMGYEHIDIYDEGIPPVEILRYMSYIKQHFIK